MPVVRFEDIALANVRFGKRWRWRQCDSADITELAESITASGPLKLITVDLTQEPGQYELVAKCRHFLAARRLARATIVAGILNRPHDEGEARKIAGMESVRNQVSLENLTRLQRMTTGGRPHASALDL